MMMYPNDFLTKLSLQQHQTKYAKITALDINEQAEESIQGAITSGGPISIDGASALRRTCNLTIAAEKPADTDIPTITDAYWGLSHKFKLEIGLKNTIDSSYPDIIWLKQGIYVIKSFSVSHTATHLNVNISGQDKMSKLNGDMGGLFPTQTKLDTIEEVAKDGSVTYVKQHIRDIIRNMVHELGSEPWQNIIIEDLPDYGYELWNYIGCGPNGEELPMYLFREADSKAIKNMTINQNMYVYRLYNPSTSEMWFVQADYATGQIEIVDASGLYNAIITQEYRFMLKEILDSELYRSVGDNEFNIGARLTLVENGDEYYIQKIRQGDIAGYHKTPLIYPGDLIANAGETIVSALDKIKSVLGDFEYFYDVDGRFVFRKKKTYVNSLFSPITNNNTIEAFTQVSQYTYEFKDDQLLSSISLSPSIGEVKNDFTIWGNKRSSSGDKLPVHARFAVDKKPEKYTTFPYYKKCFDMAFIKLERAFEEKTDDKGEEKIVAIERPNNSFESYYDSNKTKIVDPTKLKSINTSSQTIKTGKYIVISKNTNKTITLKPYSYKGENITLTFQEETMDELNVDDMIEIKKEKEDSDLYDVYRYATDKEKLNWYYIVKYTTNEKDSELYMLNDTRDELLDIYTEGSRTFYLKEDNLFVPITAITNLDETYYLAEDTTTYYAFSGDNLVDWRELIYLMARDYYQHNQDPNYNIKLYQNNPELVKNGSTGYEPYYYDMQIFWRNLYDPYGQSPQYINAGETEAEKYLYWSRNVIYYPESLDFWIDFLDTGGEIDKYSISQIGRRPKIEQESASGVTAIFYKETPDVEFIVMPKEKPDKDHNDQVHTPIFIQDNMKQLFTISSRGKASNERIDELIWKHVCVAGGANITCIPLYFLDVNTRVKYKDEDYIVSKISLPVAYNGMMQLTLSKIINPI